MTVKMNSKIIKMFMNYYEHQLLKFLNKFKSNGFLIFSE